MPVCTFLILIFACGVLFYVSTSLEVWNNYFDLQWSCFYFEIDRNIFINKSGHKASSKAARHVLFSV